MRQLPPAGLALSPALAAADPPVLAAASGVAIDVSTELNRQAEALSAATGELATGFWVSPAASAFVAQSREQARRLRVAAALIADLGAVLAALAARLASARSDALAAMACGQQADFVAEELNQRVRVQHTLLPQDPDSLLLSERETEAVANDQIAAASALQQAEMRAREAWRQAQADLDLVAYATPAMRQRMSAAGWDPAASVRLAATGSPALACGVMDQLGLGSKGVITGPDGREYPLVVQTARGSDGSCSSTSRENPDASGYRQLAVRYGTTSYGRRAATWEKVAVALGGAAGAPYPEGSSFTPGLLRELRLMTGGGAYLEPGPVEAQDPVKEAPAERTERQEARELLDGAADGDRRWPAGGGAGRHWRDQRRDQRDAAGRPPG